MLQITVENTRGERLDLFDSNNYVVTNVDGLNPPTANINTTSTATFDGSTYKSSRTNERNIVITLTITDNPENVRHTLFRYFRPKTKVTLYLKTSHRNVYTIGYVETFDVNLFGQQQAAQISIICPFPYFIDVEENVINFSVTSDNLIFPFAIPSEGIPFSNTAIDSRKSIINNGDVDSGLIIELRATGTVLNPKIYNEDTNEYFILNVEMQQGHLITINTNKGEKGVIQTIAGVNHNIINDIEPGSSWFNIEPGDNIFMYSADEYPANLNCTFRHSDKYGGV